MDLFSTDNIAKIPRTQAIPSGLYAVQITDLRPKKGSKGDPEAINLQPQFRHLDTEWAKHGSLFDSWLPIRYSVGDKEKENAQLGKTTQLLDALKADPSYASIIQFLVACEGKPSDWVVQHVSSHLKPHLVGKYVGVRVSMEKDGRNSVRGYEAYNGTPGQPSVATPVPPPPLPA